VQVLFLGQSFSLESSSMLILNGFVFFAVSFRAVAITLSFVMFKPQTTSIVIHFCLVSSKGVFSSEGRVFLFGFRTHFIRSQEYAGLVF